MRNNKPEYFNILDHFTEQHLHNMLKKAKTWRRSSARECPLACAFNNKVDVLSGFDVVSIITGLTKEELAQQTIYGFIEHPINEKALEFMYRYDKGYISRVKLEHEIRKRIIDKIKAKAFNDSKNKVAVL